MPLVHKRKAIRRPGSKEGHVAPLTQSTLSLLISLHSSLTHFCLWLQANLFSTWIFTKFSCFPLTHVNFIFFFLTILVAHPTPWVMGRWGGSSVIETVQTESGFSWLRHHHWTTQLRKKWLQVLCSSLLQPLCLRSHWSHVLALGVAAAHIGEMRSWVTFKGRLRTSSRKGRD